RLSVFGLTNDVPLPVEETVAACLSKDPSQRPHSAHEVAERLGLVESKGPRSKGKPQPSSWQSAADSTPWSAGEKRAVRVAILAATLLLGFAAFYVGFYLPRLNHSSGAATGSTQNGTKRPQGPDLEKANPEGNKPLHSTQAEGQKAKQEAE